jgi:predicted dienelactone hydrolase
MPALRFFGLLLAAATLAFHAGERPFSFQAQQFAAQLGVDSSRVNGLVWYPAGAEAPERQQWGGEPGHPLFDAGSAAAAAAIAPSPKTFALVLLSHGTGGSAMQMAWLGTALARAGYVAVAIDHPGNTAAGTPTVQGFTLFWLRARELSMALDAALADPVLGPRIDRTRIGAAGFSLGGYTAIALAGARVDFAPALAACAKDSQAAGCQGPPEFPDLGVKMRALQQSDPSYANALANSGVSVADPRVRAVYAIAPAAGPFVTLDSLETIAVPVRIAYGSNDTVAPPPANAQRYAGAIPGSTVLEVPGAGHYTFLDVCTPLGVRAVPALCADAPGVDRSAIHARVAADAIEFFDRTLAP